MLKKHLKSACCRAKVISHGGKRRKCAACGHTWTNLPKRRGRKPFRASADLIERYFSGSISTVRTLAEHNHWNRDRAQQMVRRSLANYVAKHEDNWSAPLPNRGRLIAIADAIWHRLDGEKITIYLILLRPVANPKATIALPFFAPGHETGEGWAHAWEHLPNKYKSRICALVSDGQKWLTAFGYRRGWVVQRCQFHLIANLEMYLGVQNRKRNSSILTLVNALFAATHPKRSRDLLTQLAYLRTLSKSRGIRRVLSGLATNYRDFQNYLRYPKLNLPTTTNAAESCINGMRGLMRRCRGFRSEEALKLWITGYVLWKKTIYCNGKKPQK